MLAKLKSDILCLNSLKVYHLLPDIGSYIEACPSFMLTLNDCWEDQKNFFQCNLHITNNSKRRASVNQELGLLFLNKKKICHEFNT